MSTLELWAAAKIDSAGAQVNGFKVTSTSRPSAGVFNMVLENALDTTEIACTITPSYVFGALLPPKVVYAYSLDPADFKTVEIRVFGLGGLVTDTDFDVVVHRFTPG